MSEEEMTEIDILEVNEAEARLNRQSNQPSTSQSQTGTTKNVPQKMDTSEKEAGFPPLKGAAASSTETVPQRKRSSGKSSRASSTESRSSGKGLLASLKEKFTQKPQIPILQLSESDVAPHGEQPLPGLMTVVPHQNVKPIPVKPIPKDSKTIPKSVPKQADTTKILPKTTKKKGKDPPKPIE
ncbi:MAG: hypothetical protein GY820_29805, partial [Gammaproteobacteria bacterium]|nr:hypothetical protein [Gammaproteobacteria bacterium]